MTDKNQKNDQGKSQQFDAKEHIKSFLKSNHGNFTEQSKFMFYSSPDIYHAIDTISSADEPTDVKLKAYKHLLSHGPVQSDHILHLIKKADYDHVINFLKNHSKFFNLKFKDLFKATGDGPEKEKWGTALYNSKLKNGVKILKSEYKDIMPIQAYDFAGKNNVLERTPDNDLKHLVGHAESLAEEVIAHPELARTHNINNLINAVARHSGNREHLLNGLRNAVIDNGKVHSDIHAKNIATLLDHVPVDSKTAENLATEAVSGQSSGGGGKETEHPLKSKLGKLLSQTSDEASQKIISSLKDPEALLKIGQEGGPQQIKAVLSNPALIDSDLEKQHINNGTKIDNFYKDLKALYKRAAEHNLINDDHINSILSKNAHTHIFAAYHNNLIPQSQKGAVIDKFRELATSKNEHDKIKSHIIASDLPDVFDSVPDLHEEHFGIKGVSIHPAVEKLKHLKGILQEAGGKIHKKDPRIANYQNAIGPMLDHSGHITPDAIDKYIDSLPKQRYYITTRKWSGMQRHDSRQQTVLQVNLSRSHEKALKDQGLYDTFLDANQRFTYAEHPAKDHTIGWVRIDDSQPGHYHIDEAQSDLLQGISRKISDAKKTPPKDPAYIERLQQIQKILLGGFKNGGHMLLSAAHEYARQNGIKSTSIDMPMDQAFQSKMKGTSVKDLPGHMQYTYHQWPTEHKFEVRPKKEVMPGSKSLETHLQYRKLIKSLNSVKSLINTINKKNK